jgi:hypothetical protein
VNRSDPRAALDGIAAFRSTGATVAVFTAATVAGVVLSATVASGPPILAARWSLLWQLGLWAAAWAIAVAAALRLPRRLAIGLIVAGAIAIRLAALAGPPTTSDDLYRYSWDGQVQSAGIDPYAFPPSSPQLAGQRTAWLWPDDAGCAALHRPPGCTRINRPGVRTIYPPVAEAWFTVVSRIAGGSTHHKPWQVAGLLADLATVGLVAVALMRAGRDPRWLALYALCPAAALEFVNNGHVDGLAVTFIVAALVVAAGRSGPRRATVGRDIAIGLLLGAAVLVKLYPALLLVALAGMPRLRPWVSVARSTIAAAMLAVVGYVPHVLSVGVRVVGYLPGYLKEERYSQGGRFLLAGAVGLSGRPAAAFAAAGVLGAVAWVVWRRPDPRRAATVLLVALFLAATPVQPWYAVSLLAVATIASWPWAAAVLLAGYPYFFALILDYRHTVALGRASYGAALGVVVVASYRQHRHGRSAGKQGGDVENPVQEVVAGATPALNTYRRGERDPHLALPVAEGLQPSRRQLIGGAGQIGPRQHVPARSLDGGAEGQTGGVVTGPPGSP